MSVGEGLPVIVGTVIFEIRFTFLRWCDDIVGVRRPSAKDTLPARSYQDRRALMNRSSINLLYMKCVV